MVKNYADELTTWTSQQRLARRDKNRIAFEAVTDDVKVALAAGFSIKTVWTNLRESNRIAFRYETFLKYVKTMPSPIEIPPSTPSIQPDAEASKPTKVNNLAAKPIDDQPATTNRQNELKGFVFNPIPNPEELF